VPGRDDGDHPTPPTRLLDRDGAGRKEEGVRGRVGGFPVGASVTMRDAVLRWSGRGEIVEIRVYAPHAVDWRRVS